MPGFVVMVGQEVQEPHPSVPYRSLRSLAVDRFSGDGYVVERFANTKFLRDKVFAEDEDVLVALDGVVLNFEDLRRSSGCADRFHCVKKMYEEQGDRFFGAFRGEFGGLLYDKRKKKWLLFTNQVGSKSLFFYHDADLFVCASELKVVTQRLRKFGRPCSLDTAGAYFLLTYGYMLEDYTLLKEVKKLKAGHYLEVGEGGVRVGCYHRLENEPCGSHPKEKILDTLEELFREAVRLEYEKDVEYGYRHLAALSGGLDTRMAVVTAHELGYTDITNLTFAQSGALDERIAQRIAADLCNEFLFYALDNGMFLPRALEGAIMANDGLVIWAGAAHELTALSKVDFGQYGMLHTGQIGDAVLGSFLSEPNQRKPLPLRRGAYSKRLMGRIADVVERLAGAYNSEEIFLFYNRAFNGALNGNWMTYQFTESGSPFLDPDFLAYALRIPPAMRYEEAIYEEWILAKHPRAARYIWANTQAYLSDGKIVRFIRNYAWRALARLLPRLFPRSMNPFDEWYKTNDTLRRFFTDYYDRNAWLLESEPQLSRDCKQLYDEGRVLEKCQVMTLLEGIKLHWHGG